MMKNVKKSLDLDKRMYKFILEHYPNAREGVVYEEIESVMALWGEFLLNEINNTTIVARLEELKWLQKQYDNKPRDEWFKDPIPKRIKELEKLRRGK